MNLTLHIGMSRAGGREIQQSLDAMRGGGGRIAGAVDHYDLYLLGNTEVSIREYRKRCGAPADGAIEACKDRLRSVECDHLVLSNLALFNFSEPEFVGNLIVELREVFPEIRVLLYLRSQMEDFVDLVQERVIAGMKDWDRILSVPVDLYAYDRVTDVWEEFADVEVRDYGRCPDGVLADFCAATGLEAPADPAAPAAAPRLGGRSLRLMEMVNASADPRKDKLRRQIARELPRFFPEDSAFRPSRELRQQMIDLFAEGNRFISEFYLDGAGFAPADPA